MGGELGTNQAEQRYELGETEEKENIIRIYFMRKRTFSVKATKVKY